MSLNFLNEILPWHIGQVSDRCPLGYLFTFIYTIKVLNLSVERSMEQSIVPSTFLRMCLLLLKEHIFVLLFAFGNLNFKPV